MQMHIGPVCIHTLIFFYFFFQVTSYKLVDLKQSEVYIIKLHAVSVAGVGEPAYVEIYTPTIYPCGSDKDPGMCKCQ